jgi:chemotaxis protein CheY-P-specific phosphatase CheC
MAEDGPLSQADIDALTAGLLGDAAASSAFDSDALRPEAELILEQASAVLGTLLNRQAALRIRDIRACEGGSLAEGLDDQGLMVRLAFEQGLPGELCLLVRKETAARLSGIMMGGDGNAPYKDEDADALNEFGNQFMGAICTALGARHGTIVSPSQARTSDFDVPPFDPPGAAQIDADLSIEGSPDSLFRVLLSPDLASRLGAGASAAASAVSTPP